MLSRGKFRQAFFGMARNGGTRICWISYGRLVNGRESSMGLGLDGLEMVRFGL